MVHLIPPQGMAETTGPQGPRGTDAEIRAALERHWADLSNQEVVHELYHPDVVLEFPQGGERLVGLANVRAMREAYPAVVSLEIGRIRGSGDLWVAENLITYDGATSLHAVTIMEFRDGQVVRETIYFGEPWAPPDWRAQWVEPMPPAAPSTPG